MKYVELQNKLIIEYRIVHKPDSKCWNRTHCHPKERQVCKHHIKESYKSLFTLLHEIGHIETDRPSMRRCEQESEATLWAVDKLKQLGIPVKRKVIKEYKGYIKMTYDRGVRRGLTGCNKKDLFM